MKFIALKELPNGIRPGETFEATEDEGKVLMLPGVDAARPVDDPDVKVTRRPRYSRRDMTAVET